MHTLCEIIHVGLWSYTPPRTHDLLRLIEMVGLDLEDETMEFIDSVNTFNISTRYPDEK